MCPVITHSQSQIFEYLFSFLPLSINYLLVCKHWYRIARRALAHRDDNRAIVWACRTGKPELVKYLLTLPKVDPTSRYNACIQFAVGLGHDDVVKELLKDKRVPRVRMKK